MWRSVPLVLILLFAPIAQALFQLRDGWEKVDVSSDSPIDVAQFTSGTHAQLLWSYSDRWKLFYAPTAEMAVIEQHRASALASRYTFDDNIYMGITVDPKQGIGAYPPEQRITSYPAGEYGIYVIQFIGRPDPAWLKAIEATGAKIQNYLHENGNLITATPEQFESVRVSPYLQWADFYHPFEKFGLWRNLDLRPESRYSVSIQLAAAPDMTHTIEEVHRVGTHVSDYRYGAIAAVVRGADVLGLLRLPLAVSITPDLAAPHVFTVWPRRARAGSWVTFSGYSMDDMSDVVFGTATSTEVEQISGDRVRVRIPSSVPNGPIDPLLRTSSSEQLLSAAWNASLIVDSSSSRRAFAADDILWGGSVYCGDIAALCNDEVDWRDRVGSWNERFRLPGFATCVFVDPSGSVNFASVGDVSRFDREGLLLGSAPAFAKGAQRVIYDRVGNAVVIRIDGTGGRYAPDGHALATFGGFQSSSDADLAADQCTLYYTASGDLRVYDVCNNRALPPRLQDATAYGVRVLPDGTLFVLTDRGVLRLTQTGAASLQSTLATNAKPPAYLSAYPDRPPLIALSADGTHLVLGEFNVSTYDLASGVSTPIAGHGQFIASLFAVYGAWTAARGHATYIDAPSIDDVIPTGSSPGERVTLRGSGFRAGNSVFVNGTGASITNIASDTITFTMPQMTTPRHIVVRDLDGQEASITDEALAANVPAFGPIELALLLVVLAIAGIVRRTA